MTDGTEERENSQIRALSRKNLTFLGRRRRQRYFLSFHDKDIFSGRIEFATWDLKNEQLITQTHVLHHPGETEM